MLVSFPAATEQPCAQIADICRETPRCHGVFSIAIISKRAGKRNQQRHRISMRREFPPAFLRVVPADVSAMARGTYLRIH
jgi:hypothetical protein